MEVHGLSGPSKCYMDVPYRTAWNLFDGENTENTKEMGVFTDSNYCCCSGNDAGNNMHGRLLWCWGFDSVSFSIFFRGRKWWCLLGQFPTLYWINIELLGGLMYPVQLFGVKFEFCQQGLALLALIPIWLYRGRQGYHSKLFQYSCYAFYPVHMLVLVLILECVN